MTQTAGTSDAIQTTQKAQGRHCSFAKSVMDRSRRQANYSISDDDDKGNDKQDREDAKKAISNEDGKVGQDRSRYGMIGEEADIFPKGKLVFHR